MRVTVECLLVAACVVLPSAAQAQSPVPAF